MRIIYLGLALFAVAYGCISLSGCEKQSGGKVVVNWHFQQFGTNYRAKEGSKFAVMRITVENQGYTPCIQVGAYDFALSIGGVEYPATLGPIMAEKADALPDNVAVCDGGTVSGLVAFEVPKESMSGELKCSRSVLPRGVDVDWIRGFGEMK